MTVNELIEKLTEARENGHGESDVFCSAGWSTDQNVRWPHTWQLVSVGSSDTVVWLSGGKVTAIPARWVRRDPDSGQVWDELTDTQMGNLIAACRAGQRPDVSEVVEHTDDRVTLAVISEGRVPAGTATYTRES